MHALKTVCAAAALSPACSAFAADSAPRCNVVELQAEARRLAENESIAEASAAFKARAVAAIEVLD